jgi:hypothetical protein
MKTFRKNTTKLFYLVLTFLMLMTNNCEYIADTTLGRLQIDSSISMGFDLKIIQLTNNNYVIAYSKNSDVNYLIKDSSFTSTVMASQIATESTLYTQTGPAALELLSNGSFVMFWMSNHIKINFYNIYFRVFTSTGVGGSDIAVTTGNCNSPLVAIAPLTDAFALIYYCNSINSQINGVIYSNAGVKKSTFTVSEKNGSTGSYIYSLSADTLPNGNFVVAFNYGTTTFDVFAYIFNPSGGVVTRTIYDAEDKPITLTEIEVNSTKNTDCEEVFVKALRNSYFIITWTDYGVSPSVVRAATFNSIGFSSRGEVSFTSSGDLSLPNISPMKYGGYVMSYSRLKAGVRNIYYQVYNENNVHVLTETQVSTGDYDFYSYSYIDSNNAYIILYTSSVNNMNTQYLQKYDANYILTCSNFQTSVTAGKAGSFGFYSGVNGDLVTSGDIHGEVLSTPAIGTLTAALNTEISSMTYAYSESTTTSFTFRASLESGSYLSPTSCTLTVVICYYRCGSCSQPGTADNMNCIGCPSGLYRKQGDTSGCYENTLQFDGYFFESSKSRFSLCYSSCNSCNKVGKLEDHMCLSCFSGYYPLEDKTSQCFTSTTPIDEYTFIPADGKFRRICYASCNACATKGTDADHKCTACKATYFKLSDNSAQCYLSTATLSGYYFSTDVFNKCYASCDTCTQTGTSTNHLCATCLAGHVNLEDDNTKCYLTSDTVPGYYFSTNIFKKCYTSCNSCSQTGTITNHLCDTCIAGSVILEDKITQCFPSTSTQAGYFFASDKFKKCFDKCDSCSQTGDSTNHLCTTCISGFSHSEDKTTQCYSNADHLSGYYFSINTFKKCYSSCDSCSQTGDSTNHLCSTCLAGYTNLEDDNTKCFSTGGTVSGYYLFNNIFKKCYDSCESCTQTGNSTNHLCSTCRTNNFILEDKPTQCFLSTQTLSGYYFSTNKFKKCYDSCNSCSQTGDSTNHLCSTCLPGYFNLEDSSTQCFSSTAGVPKYYFSINVFKKCYSSCNSCQQTGNFDNHLCATCKDTYFSLEDKLSQCYRDTQVLSGYYFSQGIFKKCYGSCESCVQTGNFQDHLCTVCRQTYFPKEDHPSICNPSSEVLSGYYYNNDVFKLCFISCESCQVTGDSNAHLCSSCRANYYPLVDKVTQCFPSTQFVPTYYFSNMNIFKKCYISCLSCSDSGDTVEHNCVICQNSYYPLEDKNSLCHVKTDILSGYFFNKTFFQLCYDSCDSCTETGNAINHLCITCKEGYFILENYSTQCFKSTEVISGYFFDQNVFKRCYSTCETCTKVGDQKNHLCSKCIAGYFSLEDNQSQCYNGSDSISGYFFSKNVFKKCYKSCDSCTQTGTESTHICTTCAAGFFKLTDNTSQCYENKATVLGYYYNSQSQTFKKCYPTCTQCYGEGSLSDNNCISCSEDTFPIQDNLLQCTKGTIEGYILNTANKKYMKCYSSCSSCLEIGNDKEHKCAACAKNYYHLDESSSNCYDSSKPPEGYTYSDGKFKKCYETCSQCIGVGNTDDHKCSNCTKEYYPLQDNTSQCFTSDTKFSDYVFQVDKFKKCDDGKCDDIHSENSVIEGIQTNDPSEFSSSLDKMLDNPGIITTNLIENIANDLKIPVTAGVEVGAKLNNVLSNYLDFLNKSNLKDVPNGAFKMVEKIMSLQSSQVGNIPEKSHALKEQYDKTVEILKDFSDLVIVNNIGKADRLIKTDKFEIALTDYQEFSLDSDPDNFPMGRSSMFEMNECARRIRNFLKLSPTDPLPVRVLELKSNSMDLNPYIRENKDRVTEIITGRTVDISAVHPVEKTRLKMEELCKGIELNYVTKADEFTQFNHTLYEQYKDLDIDIHDKTKIDICNSFLNRNSSADFTSSKINNITDVAIDCGGNCTYVNINSQKGVTCNCPNSFFKTQFNVFRQDLLMSFHRTQLEIILCLSSAFAPDRSVLNNPGMWFIVSMVASATAFLVISQLLYNPVTVYDKSMRVYTNLKGIANGFNENDDVKDGPDEKKDEQNDKKEEKEEKDDLTEEKIETHKADPEHITVPTEAKEFKGRRAKRTVSIVMKNQSESSHKINPATSENCTAKELLDFDERNTKEYLKDLLLTKHQIGKVFFLPPFYTPRYLTIMYFVQMISIKFALNAILYDDMLINERNDLPDNVSTL